MLRNVDLYHFMIPHPAKVTAEDNLMTAMEIIMDRQISGVCVVDERDRLVGILSELDCLRGILSATYNGSTVGKVKEFMTNEDLITAGPNDAIVDIAQDMLGKKIRRRPVVDDEGRLLGQITIRQILRAVKGFQERKPARD
jgi:CBS domain-containing protein